MLTKKYDVVVVGSGPAGIGAAIAAARGGASTLIVEKNSVLGGMMTSGLVTGFHGMRSHQSSENRRVGSFLTVDTRTPLMSKGLPLELCNRLVEAHAACADKDEPPMRTEFDPQVMIPLLFNMMKEYGVHILLDTFVFGVGMSGKRIEYIKVANKSGETHIYAKQFVDCSADADVAAWAGAPFEKGGADGRCMPVTIYSIIGNVDLEKLFAYYREHPEDIHTGTVDGWYELYKAGKPLTLVGNRDLIMKAAEKGDYPRLMNQESVLPNPIFDIQTSYLPEGYVKIQADMAYGIDITDGDELSKAEMEIRTVQIPGIFRFLKKYAPGFENARLMETASLIGTRESRRIIGYHMLTKEEANSNFESSESIGRCGRAMNVHSSGNPAKNAEAGGQQWIEQPKPTGYAIPYGCLVPHEVDNLLVGGRCISVDRNVLGSVRGEPTCMVTGEAAGEAAALCIKEGVNPADLNVRKLQEMLLAHNVEL